ncbi:MAG TPA: hypothetical protein VKB21_04435, partial [Candidatus Acidoferrum sp.]|nr:hypothetical protein [Candidatus Acidoferrum sp.]
MVPTTDKAVVLSPDAGHRESLRLLLRGAGYEVMAAEVLEAAAATLRAGEADLVLLDDSLPNTTVQAVLTSIENLPIAMRPRVVLLCAADAAQRGLWLDQGI